MTPANVCRSCIPRAHTTLSLRSRVALAHAPSAFTGPDTTGEFGPGVPSLVGGGLLSLTTEDTAVVVATAVTSGGGIVRGRFPSFRCLIPPVAERPATMRPQGRMSHDYM